MVSAADKPRLVLDKNNDGFIAVSMDIFDSDDNPKIIAKIEKNQFTINRNNFFRFKLSDDKSRLTVEDQHDITVLDIHYLNKSAIQIESVMYFPELSQRPLTISSTDITYQGKAQSVRSHNDCFNDTLPKTPLISIFPKDHRGFINIYP